MNSKKNESCRLCLSNNINKMFSLGSSPLGNDLSFSLNNTKKLKFPLEIFLCKDCGHLQLGISVDKKLLYQNNYSYLSGTSKVFEEYLKNYAHEIIKEFKLNSRSSVLEIGSNDGTCLKFFKNKKCQVLGIDPAEKPAQKAVKQGITTIIDFFNLNQAKYVKKKYGSFSLITSHNALAHVDDLLDIFNSVKYLLKTDGIFIFEVGYRLEVIKNNLFDTIYHEHIDYHAFTPLKSCLEKLNFKVFKVKKGNQQGGSLRVYCSLDQKVEEDQSVQKFLQLEKKERLFDKETYTYFYKNILDIRNKFKKILNDLLKNNFKIVGFGVPTKATTLMTAFHINSKEISYFVDENPLKQNMYTPVDSIPIYSSNKLLYDLPDVIIIFAWNFSESIYKKYSHLKEKGVKFIVPLPYPRFI